MSGRLARLYRRYMRHQLVLDRKGPRLDPAGEALRMKLAEGRLWVEGQARAQRVVLCHDGQRRAASPKSGLGPARIQLSLPYRPGPAHLLIEAEGQEQRLDLPVFSQSHLALAQMRLWPRFIWQVAQALPPILSWLRFRDPASRDRVKRLLGLVQSSDLLLDPAIFHAPPPEEQARGALGKDEGSLPPKAASLGAPITILLPVYQAHDLLALCLDHLGRHSGDLPWRLIAIEDASPDARILPLLQKFQRSRPEGQVEILQNPVNLGFIGSVNRGLAKAAEAGASAPVILLNSDALVPPGWLRRLVAPILADPEGVASVTPMSNDAELATVPRISARLDLFPGEALAIDQVAARFQPGQGLASAPTGVGFCMALNPRFLALEPQLDPAFGRGYGEEVDWCQKVARQGGRHLYQPGLFVEHRGGSSFGSAEKQRLLAKNAARLTQFYPDFDLEVQQWLAEDPLITPRLALGLALLAARAETMAGAKAGAGPAETKQAEIGMPENAPAETGPEKTGPEKTGPEKTGPSEAEQQRAAFNQWGAEEASEGLGAGQQGSNKANPSVPPTPLVPIYLAHSLGGGAEHWLMGQIAEDLARQGGAVVLRVGGARRWRIELHGPTGVLAGESDDLALVKALLFLLPRRRVIYSCAVGDPDPITLPKMLLDLSQGPEHRLDLLLHDYFPLSPSYTLLGRDGGYHGLPQPDRTKDIAHSLLRPDGSRASLAEWRAAWDALAARADQIVVFSPASRALAKEAWPDLEDRLILRPHQPKALPPRLVPKREAEAGLEAGPQTGPKPESDLKAEGGQAAPLRQGGPRVIGVPGNISQHKGAELLVALSRLLARRRADLPRVQLVILGDLDPAYALARPARVHGPYQPKDFAPLARRYGVTDWLIPSIWPETFSFTTHEALATGLPVWCLDLGAQADAVRAALARGAPGGVIAVGAGAALPQNAPAEAAVPSARLVAERILARITGSEDPGDSG